MVIDREREPLVRCDREESHFRLGLHEEPSKDPELIYCMVARGKTILGEQMLSSRSGNIRDISRRILPRVNDFAPGSKTTYHAKGYSFNILKQDGRTYLVMADEAIGREMPFLFLEHVRSEFHSNVEEPDEGTSDTEGEEQELWKGSLTGGHSGNSLIGRGLEAYLQSDEVLRANRLDQGLADVQQVLKVNLDKMVERGEQIGVLVDRSSHLRMEANVFRKGSKALQRKMCLDNFKSISVFAFSGILLLYVMLASVCGLGLQC